MNEETNKEKGDNYEIQIKNYIQNVLNKRAYLWSEHPPENILIKSNILGSHNEARLKRINDKLIKENKELTILGEDTGIDIIQVEDDESCSLVQCKNGYKNGIRMEDLAGFMCWTSVLDKLNGYVYYTSKLSNKIESLPKNNRIQFIKQEYEENIKHEIVSSGIIPYDYQLEAKKQFDDNFVNRGILSMPCGTGKTYLAYLISLSYKQVIIISPLKQFAKQNLDRFVEYGFSGNNLLVDSDGERDIGTIKKFIEKNDSFLISSTYCSVDVIYFCLQFMKDPFFIVDEFHNLSKNNLLNKDDDFYKLLNSASKILFLSATPRVMNLKIIRKILKMILKKNLRKILKKNLRKIKKI